MLDAWQAIFFCAKEDAVFAKRWPAVNQDAAVLFIIDSCRVYLLICKCAPDNFVCVACQFRRHRKLSIQPLFKLSGRGGGLSLQGLTANILLCWTSGKPPGPVPCNVSLRFTELLCLVFD